MTPGLTRMRREPERRCENTTVAVSLQKGAATKFHRFLIRSAGRLLTGLLTGQEGQRLLIYDDIRYYDQTNGTIKDLLPKDGILVNR